MPTITRFVFSVSPGISGRLTVKLRGRAQASDWSRGRTLSSRARGETTARHGTLRRLLDGDLAPREISSEECTDHEYKHKRDCHYSATHNPAAKGGKLRILKLIKAPTPHPVRVTQPA